MVTLYRNGILFPTITPTDFLVEDGKIAAIGASVTTGPFEQEVSLAGCFVYPGFHDAHCHFLSIVEREFRLDLGSAKDFVELEARARHYLNSHQNITAIHGVGLNENDWTIKKLPTATDLDRITKDRPILFYRICGHVAVVNSAVLKLVPVLKKSAPDGILSENDLDLITHLIPRPRPEDKRSALLPVLKRLASYGLTALSSNDTGRFMNEENREFYREIRPLVETYLNLRTQHTPPLDFRESSLDRLDPALTGENPAVKVYVDGSLGGRTALLFEPYSDMPENRGVSALDPEDHLRIASATSARGLQMMTHAIGDLALARTLDVYEKVTEKGNPLRHAVIHAQIADDRLLTRMARLGILAIVQPSFTKSDLEMAKPRLGGRFFHAYRFKKMAHSGIPLAFSSDAPIESIQPLVTIRDALTASENNDEHFSFDEALSHHTRSAAFADHLETKKGQLREGFDADFVIFAKNLAATDPLTLPDIKPILTVKAGHVTFRR